MLYQLQILVTTKKPQLWDDMSGVTVVACRTPDLHPLAEDSDPNKVLSLLSARHVLGRVPSDFNLLGASYADIRCDGLGCIYAAPEGSKDEDEEVQLSHMTWRQVGSAWLRVEPVYESDRTWESINAGYFTLRRRILNLLLRRSCGRCLFFDRVGAQQWRTCTTHHFLGGMRAEMNDDITKIAATNYRAPDFQPDELGYCPKRDCGLSSTLSACKEFRRRKGRESAVTERATASSAEAT